MGNFFQSLFKTERALESVHIHARPRPYFNLERPALAAVLDGRIPASDQGMSDDLKNALRTVYGRNLEWASYFDAIPEGCVGIKLRIVETGAFFTWGTWNGVAKMEMEIHDYRTPPLRRFTVPIAAQRRLFNANGAKTADKVAARAWELASAELIACIDKTLTAIRGGTDLHAALLPPFPNAWARPPHLSEHHKEST